MRCSIGVLEDVGDDAETDPPMDAVGATIARPSEPVSAFYDADPAFTPGAPPRPATKPALTFMGASGRGPAALHRQHHSADAQGLGRALVVDRGKPAVTGRQIWRATKDLTMVFKRRHPERGVGLSMVVHGEGRNDLVLGFLNRDYLAEFRRPGDLALANGFGMRLEKTEHLVGHVRIPADHARVGLATARSTSGRIVVSRCRARRSAAAAAPVAVRSCCPVRRRVVRTSRRVARVAAMTRR